jgi:transposase
VLDQPRTTQRYRAAPDEEEQRLESRLLELVRAHPRYGYRRMTALLQREGWWINCKRVYRLWRRQGLRVPQKAMKKTAFGAQRQQLPAATGRAQGSRVDVGFYISSDAERPDTEMVFALG